MLCDKCLNRTICKYYEFLKDAPMIINIESCEKARIPAEQPIFKNPNDNIALLNKFKQPIDYSSLNIEETEDETFEDEEKITVNLSECTEPTHSSILDILIGGNNDDNSK